jgi:hypothetical protein
MDSGGRGMVFRHARSLCRLEKAGNILFGGPFMNTKIESEASVIERWRGAAA